MNSLPLETQCNMLLQGFYTNGGLTLPPIAILPERMYKKLTHRKKPGNKPTNTRSLLQFFVSEAAKRIQITNPLVIGEVTRKLMLEANINEYRIFAAEINLLIKSRSISQ
ncbi:hypothetical protein GLOIN_2v1767629 [Rhizophagus clarus]|uniref:Uncharacterized protein n=1 Tax=Rhizophagus clarus TaxID=94130 RepID=A0A8H3LKZ6_9GLOM|nr:hypothetical protein GLOIN_2v1767629 [Rhizophagus clarus]